MLKTASLFASGVGAGVLAMLILRPALNPEEGTAPVALDRPSSAPVSATLSDGADSSDEELVDIAELEDLIIELYAELQESRRSVAYYEEYEAAQAARMQSSTPIADQLVAAGFTQERAEWIDGQYRDFLRESAEAASSVEAYARSPMGLLRKELGDAEFAEFLTAIGEPAGILIGWVPELSSGAIAGLRNGDEIVSYDGRRVFDSREVDDLELQGTAGEGVIVEVMRDGYSMQILIPRGSLDAVFESPGYYRVTLPSF